MAVSSDLAAWLKSEALFASSDGSVAGAFGDTSKDSTVITPLVNKADAVTEAAYQAAFLSGPLARDKAVIKGYRSDLIGKCVTLTGDRLGYDGAGAAVFVIGAEEAESGATTTLTVLKRL